MNFGFGMDPNQMRTETLVGSKLAMKEVQHVREEYQDQNVVQVNYLSIMKENLVDQLLFCCRYIPMNILSLSIKVYA